MGFMDKILGPKKSKLVTLTDVGQDKVENAVGDESKSRYLIAADLAEHGASSIKEIAERKGMDVTRVKNTCDAMIHDGWLRTVSS